MRCLVLILVFATILTGCGFNNNSNKAEVNAYQVTDDKNNVIQFQSKPMRVYAATLSIEEVLVDLIEPERFAAISEDATDRNYSLIIEKAAHISKKVPVKLSVEGVLALQPDLVIVQENSNQSQIEALKDVGLKVLVTKVPTNLQMVQKRIQLIADAVGEHKRGENLIHEMNDKLRIVHEKNKNLPENKRKISIAYSLLGAFGSKEGLYHDICIQAGLRNGAAMAGLVRGEHLSKEKILAVNPEILIFPRYSSTQKGDVGRLREEVLSDPSLQTVRAVKNKNFIIINDRYRYSASQYMADAIVLIAKQAYPELYDNDEKKK